MKSYKLLVFTSLGLAALAGCDGATITVTPNSSSTPSSSSAPNSSAANSSTSNSSAQSSLTPSSIASSSTFSSSSLAISSSSQSSVHICDSDTPPPGAPACYLITPDCDAITGDCGMPEYQISDYCGVRGLNAELISYDNIENCQDFNTIDRRNCDILEGRTYYSTTLGEMGNAPEGESHGRWSIAFNDGVMSFRQSDIGLSAAYTCRAGQIIATFGPSGSGEETILDLEAPLDEFTFDPINTGTKTYRYYPDAAPNRQECDLVAGNHYVLFNEAASPLEKDYYLSFAKNTSQLTYSNGQIEEQGHYECDLGQLYVHTPNHTENPINVDVAADGSSVFVAGELNLTLPLNNPTPSPCNSVEDPVCATETVQCITTPCQPLHKTYSNMCTAQAANEYPLFEGECGKLEGTLVQNLPAPCPAVVAPVCGKVNNTQVACVSEPCPTYEYKTFGNSCEAGTYFATVSFDGTCETYQLEGGNHLHHRPVRLDYPQDKSFDPVTLVSATIQGDLLTATVGYSGCDTQAIDFTLSTQFLESFPVQAQNYFSKTVNDLCEAFFTSTFEYDLAPLKAAYQTLYQTSEGTINIQGIGEYSFN